VRDDPDVETSRTTRRTPIQSLTDDVRDGLVERFGLVETGDPYEELHLASSGERVGEIRVWTGTAVDALVDVRLALPSTGLDSTMLHAFAPSGSAVPHLGTDLVGGASTVTFNADLMPRVDLAAHSDYLDAVYAPLTDARSAAYAVDGAVPVDLPLRLRAFCSPWVAAVRVPLERLDAIARPYAAYADRFAALVERGVEIDADVRALEARDRAHRRAQFDPACDDVWDLLTSIVGPDSVRTVLRLVREPGPPQPR
jgi:hypothetical protein